MTLLHGDCLEIMKNMPDKSVDLILTDPPYGKKDLRRCAMSSSKGKKHGPQRGNWDNQTPTKEIFDHLYRISKGLVIVFGGNYFCDKLRPSTCWLVWDKKGEIKFKNNFADCELIYTNSTKPVKKYVFKQQGFISDSKDVRVHPTQKPTELIMKILNDFSISLDIVFDPFMGSGSTGVACKNLNRKFIGIEQDEKYYQIAVGRCRRTNNGK